MSYVGQMAGDVARGQVERSTQRNRTMGKIAAHTIASLDNLRCRNVRSSRSEAILDVVMDPVGDCLYLRTRFVYVSKLFSDEPK